MNKSDCNNTVQIDFKSDPCYNYNKLQIKEDNNYLHYHYVMIDDRLHEALQYIPYQIYI